MSSIQSEQTVRKSRERSNAEPKGERTQFWQSAEFSRTRGFTMSRFMHDEIPPIADNLGILGILGMQTTWESWECRQASLGAMQTPWESWELYNEIARPRRDANIAWEFWF